MKILEFFIWKYSFCCLCYNSFLQVPKKWKIVAICITSLFFFFFFFFFLAFGAGFFFFFFFFLLFFGPKGNNCCHWCIAAFNTATYVEKCKRKRTFIVCYTRKNKSYLKYHEYRMSDETLDEAQTESRCPENVHLDMYTQRRFRLACTFVQSDQSIHWVHSRSTPFATHPALLRHIHP